MKLSLSDQTITSYLLLLFNIIVWSIILWDHEPHNHSNTKMIGLIMYPHIALLTISYISIIQIKKTEIFISYHIRVLGDNILKHDVIIALLQEWKMIVSLSSYKMQDAWLFRLDWVSSSQKLLYVDRWLVKKLIVCLSGRIVI